MEITTTGNYEFGDFRFEADSFRLFKNDEAVPIPHKAAALLNLFLVRRGAVIKKEEIYQTLWGEEIVEESNLTRTIYLLRKILGQPNASAQFIETLPKIGYRFTGAVREIAPALQPLTEKDFSPPEKQIFQTADEISPARDESTDGRQTTVETQLMLVNSATNTATTREINWGIFFRRVKVEPFKAAAEFAPKIWGNRRMKIATLTILPALIVCLGILFTARLSESSNVKVQSIAILPFAELDVEKRESMQGLGVADTVISRLGSFENLEVRPTSAVRRYLETPVDPLEAGRELKVETVLTGNIQRQNGSVRVTVQLLRVSDSKIIWSESFDEPASEILTLQDKLSDKLMAKLNLPVTKEKRDRFSKHGTESIAAYNHYLKGRLFWNRRTPEWIGKAIAEFEEAVKIDPNYAQAYAGIADSYALTVSGLPPFERMPKARAAAEKALALDEHLAEAHASLGFIKYKFYLDWRGAEESLKRAVKLNPNYATAHHWLGELLSIVGRFDEALAEAELAERLDPLSLPIKKDVGMVYYNWHKFDEAAAKIKETLAIDPNFAGAHQNLSLVYYQQKREDEAVAETIIFEEKSNKPPEYLAALKEAFQSNGGKGFWRKKLEIGLPPEDDAFAHAVVYLRLGENEQALNWLEKSFEERSSIVFRIKTDPLLDGLRDEPRFQTLLRRAGHTD